jgi:hypothetical protein
MYRTAKQHMTPAHAVASSTEPHSALSQTRQTSAVLTAQGRSQRTWQRADRNCSAFKTEKEKIQVRIPENKYKYFPTEVPRTWQLLNETDTNTDPQQHQHNSSTRWNAPTGDLRSQHGFMNDWHEVRCHHGRPPTMQNRQTDNGWPVRLTQTTCSTTTLVAPVRTNQPNMVLTNETRHNRHVRGETKS